MLTVYLNFVACLTSPGRLTKVIFTLDVDSIMLQLTGVNRLLESGGTALDNAKLDVNLGGLTDTSPCYVFTSAS